MKEWEKIEKQVNLILNVIVLVFIVCPIFAMTWYCGDAEDFAALVAAVLGTKLVVLFAFKIDDFLWGE